MIKTVRARIASRALTAGERLPSIRTLARSMGVSPSTVVEAYDRLVAEGTIAARPGSGFYVSGTGMPPLALAQDLPKAERAIDPFWVSRQSLDAGPHAIKPGCGWLPPDWMPADALRKAMRSVARGESGLLTDYGNTRGSDGLRRLLLGRFAEDGLEVSQDQMMLTGSGTQAVDLVCGLMLRPGDTVIVDDPCYFNFRALLRSHQVDVIGVPYTRTGPDIAAFEAALAEKKPRLYLTNSALHNPTGATLSAQNAHRVLRAASAHNLTIVEDDIFADFEPEPSVRLAALDGLERVIRIGSFSKALSASIRCGYIAARADWIAGLTDLQVATSFAGPSPVAGELIAGVLGGGSYRKHMDDVRRRLSRARQTVGGRLRGMGIEPWLMPRGGFYLWCRLPEGRDSAELARAALKDDVVLAPGNVFSASQTMAEFMRINVAQCDARALDVIGTALNRS